MYIYGDLIRYGKLRIDIEEDGVVKVNGREIDNKNRKNIAIDLMSKIPELVYHFKKGILISPDQKLEIKAIDDNMNLDKIETINIKRESGSSDIIEIKIQKFKNSYSDIHLIYWKCPYEDMEYGLKEGCRYLSLEETHHVINLIC